MTIALAAAQGPPFDPDFYTVAATVIPVLFLAIAVEHGPISTLLSASSRAANEVADLVVAYFLYLVVKSLAALPGRRQAPARKAGPLSRRPGRVTQFLKGSGIQAVIYVGLAAALVPAFLAVCTVVLGIGGEITAITTLYYKHAASWAGTFDLTSVIFLTILTGLPPAALLAQAASKALRESKPVKPAASTTQETFAAAITRTAPENPERSPDPPADSTPAIG